MLSPPIGLCSHHDRSCLSHQLYNSDASYSLFLSLPEIQLLHQASFPVLPHLFLEANSRFRPPPPPALPTATCYTALCINCGLKNSQLTLGGIAEANDSELQSERVNVWTPLTSGSIPLMLHHIAPRWHPPSGRLFALVCELLVLQSSSAPHLH